MTEHDLHDVLTDAVLNALEETFENVQGMYLDNGTSLFETLVTISAKEASQPVSANCASIAAQVEHVIYYMDLLLKQIRGEQPEVDWMSIWETVEKVSPEEWADAQTRLRETYQQVQQLAAHADWRNPGAVRGAFALVMHNAYHLGEIRQALCTIRQSD